MAIRSGKGRYRPGLTVRYAFPMALLGLLPWNSAPHNANRLRADNIDYDDIKRYIKDETTPGKGKAVSVPGRNDEKLQQFESSLFDTLKDQHLRIDLFVRSKAGEIQRRLGKPLVQARFVARSKEPRKSSRHAAK